jgi:cytoskeleton protein RodZ
MQDSTDDINQSQETPPRLGHYLRLEREKKNVSLKYITQKTKVSPTNLNFLEQDRYDLLPDKAYLTGFVKSYSKILNLDQAYCLKLLDQEFQSISPVEVELKNLKKLAPGERATPHQAPKKDSPLLIKLVGGSFATLLVVVALVYFSSDYQVETDSSSKVEVPVKTLSDQTDDPPPVDEAPNAGAAPEPTLTTEEIPSTPTTPTVSTPVARDTSTPIESSDNEENKKEEEEEETIRFRPITISTYSYQALSDEDFENWYPRTRRSPLIEGQQVLHLNALDGDTWITHKVDDEEIRRFILQQGRFVTLRGKTIRMFLGNANALKIFHNNRLVDPESRTGVKSLVFPDSARTQFQLPLFIYPGNGVVLTSDEYIEQQKND